MNELIDITQEGLENEIKWSGNDQSISLIIHFAKSRTGNGGPNFEDQKSYGVDYSKIFNT